MAFVLSAGWRHGAFACAEPNWRPAPPGSILNPGAATHLQEAGGVGTTYRQILKGPGGRRIDGDYRVTAYEPPHLLGFEVVAGPLRPVGRYELAADGAQATTLTFTLDAQPKGIMKLMGGMITKQMQSEVGHLTALKQDLETGGGQG